MIAMAGTCSMGHPDMPAFCEYGVEATSFNSLSPNLALESQCSASSWNVRLWGVVIRLGVMGRLGAGGVNAP